MLTALVTIAQPPTSAYLARRNSALQCECDASIGGAVNLSAIEQKADSVLSAAAAPLSAGSSILTRSFFDSAEDMRTSRLYELLRPMPKGAVLHTHFDSLLDNVWLLNATYEPHCRICGAAGSLDAFFRFFTDATTYGVKPCSHPAGWQLVSAVRAAAASTPAFDEALRRSFTLVPADRKAYPTVDAAWAKFQAIFGLSRGLLFYEPIFTRYAMPCYAMLRYATLCYAMRCYAMPCYAMPCYAMLRYAMLCYAMLRYAMLCYAMLCYPMPSYAMLCRYVQGVLDSFQSENVQRLEMRAGLFGNVTYALDGSGQPAKHVIALFIREAAARNMSVAFIFSSMRSADPPAIAADLVFARELAAAWPGVIVGYDLVGQEDAGRPLLDFAGTLEAAAREPNAFPYAFHAGETLRVGSTDLNLVDALLLNTSRIGHGFALRHMPALREEVTARGVAVEVCTISNQVLGLVGDLRDHPLPGFIADSVPVVISPDDPGFWGAEGTTYDWLVALLLGGDLCSGLALLKQLALNSIAHSLVVWPATPTFLLSLMRC
jgi:hypothetical protein